MSQLRNPEKENQRVTIKELSRAFLVISGIVILCCLVGIATLVGWWLKLVYFTPLTAEVSGALNCPALPQGFKESDLLGTWVGSYFEYHDKLIIQGDGTYKQIFSSPYLNFESGWQKWHVDSDAQGHVLLHLTGMRRCEDLESICNNPGGGLPSGVLAMNPCESGYVSYIGEVILFVTGSTGNVPRGIVLRQARLAGSDWNWSYQLQK